MKKRYQTLLLAFIITANALLGWSTITRGHNWGGDFAAYIMQAESIVKGDLESYLKASRFTNDQSTMRHSSVAYPWGTPLLLAPFYAVFGLNIVALKLLNLLCCSLFLLALWFGTQRIDSLFLRFLYLALFALNPYLISAMNYILSDIPYLLFSTVGIFMIGRTAVEKRVRFHPVADHVLLGIVLAASCAIRKTGYLLVITLVMAQIIRWLQGRGSLPSAINTRATVSPPPTALSFGTALLPYLVFFLLITFWRLIFTESETHTISNFAAYAAKRQQTADLTWALQKFARYIFLIGEFFDGIPHHRTVYAATIPLFAAGAVSRFKQDYHLLLYLMMVLGLYTAWTAREQLRYIMPMFPLYVYFVLIIIEDLAARPTNRLKKGLRAVAVAMLILVVAGFGLASIGKAALNLSNGRSPGDGPYTHAAQEMFAKLRAHTQPDDVIVFSKPRVMRLYAGRPSITVDEPSYLYRGDYLCLHTKGTGLQLKNELPFQLTPPEVKEHIKNGQLHFKWENTDFAIFRIDRQPRPLVPNK